MDIWPIGMNFPPPPYKPTVNCMIGSEVASQNNFAKFGDTVPLSAYVSEDTHVLQ